MLGRRLSGARIDRNRFRFIDVFDEPIRAGELGDVLSVLVTRWSMHSPAQSAD
jgi:hypothetical protein